MNELTLCIDGTEVVLTRTGARLMGRTLVLDHLSGYSAALEILGHITHTSDPQGLALIIRGFRMG